MSTVEIEVLEKLREPSRLLYPETLAAILQRPVTEIDKAVESLRAQRLVVCNRVGQWSVLR